MRMRVYVNGDERWLHDARDMEQWLQDCGSSLDELDAMYDKIAESRYQREIAHLRECVDEQEMAADGHLQDLNMLIDEVEEIAGRLRSGRSGKGYTKTDLADALDYAVRCVKSI